MAKLRFWQSPERIDKLAEQVRNAGEADEHRTHAFGVIDAKLEDEDITPKEAERLKDNWIKRHP